MRLLPGHRCHFRCKHEVLLPAPATGGERHLRRIAHEAWAADCELGWSAAPFPAFLLVLRGRLWIDRDHVRQAVPTGSLLWRQAGERWLQGADPADPPELLIAVFDGVAAPDWFRTTLPTGRCWLAPPVADQIRTTLQAILDQALDQRPYWWEACQAQAQALLWLGAQAAGQAPTTGSGLQLVQRAEQYINTHAHSLTGLAPVHAHCGVSGEHLARLFRRHRGRTPQQVWTERRLTRAAELLRAGHHRIGAIAQRFGYADTAAFSKAFKKFWGASPRAWLRRQGEDR